MKCASDCICGRHYRRVFTDETRRKISVAKMGHEVTPETREKIGVASSGRIASAETRAKMSESQKKHGYGATGAKRTPEYRAWDAMKQRCLNPNANRHEDYGGRGIGIAEAWLNFPDFIADMGDKPEPKWQYSLDRIDNDRNYEPGNCRWATRSEQQKNRPNFNPVKR